MIRKCAASRVRVGWPLVLGSALVQAASVLVFDALAGGTALDTFNQPDPSVVRVLTEASLAMNAFGFILEALFLASVSYAILATRVLPRWTGWVLPLPSSTWPGRRSRDLRGDDFMEAVVAGVTTSAGWYAYINDVMGLHTLGS